MRKVKRILQNVKRKVRHVMGGIIRYITYKLVNARQEYKRASKADDLCSFIWDYEMYLRSQYRHGEPPDDIGAIYEKWFEVKGDNNINLDDIYS